MFSHSAGFYLLATRKQSQGLVISETTSHQSMGTSAPMSFGVNTSNLKHRSSLVFRRVFGGRLDLRFPPS